MPQILVDTNIFIAVLTDEEERHADAEQLLNADHDLTTTLLNLMEIRSVLSHKKHVKRAEIENTIEDLQTSIDVIIPDSQDALTANRLQEETYLYPLDSLLLAVAENAGIRLASFDAELLEHGASAPSECL